MPASHKFQNSHIEVVSSLSPEALMKLGLEIAETTEGTGIFRPGLSNYRVHVVDKSVGVIHCRIGNKQTLMKFDVDVKAESAGSHLTTDITSFRTKP